MPKHVFYSFHYQRDYWRVHQIRQIGSIEGNPAAHPNTWEEVKRSGKNAIKKWIDDNMYGRSTVIVLIGEETAGRPWINYEIEKAWHEKKAIFGIYIDKLKDNSKPEGKQSKRGANPFDFVVIDGVPLSSVIEVYDPFFSDSQSAYRQISQNIDSWIEQSIQSVKNQRIEHTKKVIFKDFKLY